MWIKKALVVEIIIWACSWGLLNIYSSELTTTGIVIQQDIPIWSLSLQCALWTSPSIILIWLFQKYILSKQEILSFSLCIVGSILGMILLLISNIKSLFVFLQKESTNPSVTISEVGLESWSLGGSISGVFLSIIIIYMLHLLNDDSS